MSSKPKADFLRQKMREKGINDFRELATLLGIQYKSWRQSLFLNRFPIDSLKRLCELVDTTKEELVSKGFNFVEIQRRQFSPLNEYYDTDILSLMVAIANSGVESCTVGELLRLLCLQKELPKSINSELARQLLLNLKK